MTKKLNINPWVEMWIRPRQTIRSIVQFNPNYMLFILCVIYGFPLILQMAQNSSLGNRFPTGTILIATLLGSVIVGAIAINLGAFLLKWTGQWIQGKGTFQHIRAALAWSSIPNLFTILLWIINIIPFGRSVFTQQFGMLSSNNQDMPLSSLTVILQVVISVWGIIMLLKSLSEVQKFSIWKALLNIIILFVVFCVVLFVLSWIARIFLPESYPIN